MSFLLKKLIFVFLLLFFNFKLFAGVFKSENFIVFYKQINKKYIERFIKFLEKDVDDFQRKIGKYPENRVKIIIAGNDEEYLKILHPNQKIIEFSQAAYIKNNNTIIIRNPKNIIDYNSIHQIVLHEYIHSFVNYYFYNPPLWFNEGMAVYYSGDFTLDRELRFVYSYILRNSLSLKEMVSAYPKNRSEWEFFYAKSALAIKYLSTTDKNKFIYFWDRAKKKSNFYKIFRLTYIKSINSFYIEFEKYCKTHFKIMILTASSSILWGVMPFLVIIIYARKKIKYKNLYKKEVDNNE